MPRTQLQRMMFALMTVIVTVHAYVFYSLYVVNGSTLMSVSGAEQVPVQFQKKAMSLHKPK